MEIIPHHLSLFNYKTNPSPHYHKYTPATPLKITPKAHHPINPTTFIFQSLYEAYTVLYEVFSLHSRWSVTASILSCVHLDASMIQRSASIWTQTVLTICIIFNLCSASKWTLTTLILILRPSGRRVL